MEENKQEICNKLLEVLQITSNLYDLVSLDYQRITKHEEQVIATFANGHQKTVNVSMDSGTSMIRDIIGHIV